MANSDDSIRPPAQQLPDQLAEVRQRRQTHAGPRPSARRSTPQKSISRDPSPPDGVKGPDRERRLTGAMVNGGLGIDEPAPDDVLDAVTGAPTSPAAPPMASGTTPDDAVDARVDMAAESAGTHITDAPDADNWLRHHHQRRQPQRNEPSRPRGSAELPTEPTRAARGRKRVPARPLARPKATATGKTGGRSRRPAIRWVIAIVLAMAVLVVAVVVIAENSGERTGRLTAAQVLSDGWHGADPRSSEHPVYPEPVELRPARLGAAALTASRYVARRIHHPSAPVSTARSSASSASAPAASADQPSEVTPAPETTYTPPPATTTTAPTPSTGSGGGGSSTSSGGSSTSSGGSSSSASSKTTPAYGPTGSLGPGSSPDS
jgi:hypothetical protein